MVFPTQSICWEENSCIDDPEVDAKEIVVLHLNLDVTLLAMVKIFSGVL